MKTYKLLLKQFCLIVATQIQTWQWIVTEGIWNGLCVGQHKSLYFRHLDKYYLFFNHCSLSQQELVVALSHLVVQYESNFCTVALQFMEEEKNYHLPSPASTGESAVCWLNVFTRSYMACVHGMMFMHFKHFRGRQLDSGA